MFHPVDLTAGGEGIFELFDESNNPVGVLGVKRLVGLYSVRILFVRAMVHPGVAASAIEHGGMVP